MLRVVALLLVSATLADARLAAGLIDHEKLRQRSSRGPIIRQGPSSPQRSQVMLQQQMHDMRMSMESQQPRLAGGMATAWRDYGSVNAMSADPRHAAMMGGPVSGLSKRQQRFAKVEPDEDSKDRAESEISKAVGELEHMERESMRAKAWRGDDANDGDDDDQEPDDFDQNAALSAFGQRQRQIDMAKGLAGRFRTRPGVHTESEEEESARHQEMIHSMDRQHDPLQRPGPRGRDEDADVQDDDTPQDEDDEKGAPNAKGRAVGR
jgi:hypothetical protein